MLARWAHRKNSPGGEDAIAPTVRLFTPMTTSFAEANSGVRASRITKRTRCKTASAPAKQGRCLIDYDFVFISHDVLDRLLAQLSAVTSC